MSSLRKWRFPVLIGSGLVAAGILVYFANSRVNSDKTQGAIGQRDVYRDSQVNSADVAAPGSAPVATEAILQSSEYKELAKNQAFQELMHDSNFADLARQNAFAQLAADLNFRNAMQDLRFAAMVNSLAFRNALSAHADMSAALKNEAQFRAMDSNGLRMLLKNEAFLRLAQEKSFQNLIASNALRENLRNQAFANLLARSDFQGMLANRMNVRQ